MISVIALFLIIVTHWFADFYCQSDWDAKNKSKRWDALLSHTVSYSFLWIPAAYFLVGIYWPLFVAITFVAHTLTDYFTSRWVSKLFAEQDYHNGFVVVGIDQVLHYTQLILTYLWLLS